MKKNLILIITILFIFFTFWIILNFNQTDDKGQKSNSIYVSNYVLENMIDNITNGEIDVQEAYDFNKEMHSESTLTTEQVEKILQADYFFCISAQYEPYVKTLKNAVNKGESNLKIIEVGKEVAGSELVDEHIWISPKRGIQMIKVIYEKLPKIEDEYLKQYNNLISNLEKIDSNYKEAAANIEKTVYVEHDAYYWLRKDYNLPIEGISGPTHDSEPSAKRLETIIDNIKDQNINNIYNENNEELDDHITMIKNETEVGVLSLQNMEIITTINYDKVLEQNLNTMKKV